MTEIKFRAWNVVTKTMIDLKKITPLALNMDTDGLFIPFSDGLLLMQFTGLHDKNGKEIYEGDIITCEATQREINDVLDISTKTIVTYLNGYFYPFGYNCGWRSSVDNIEVHGNIYEQPDLLTTPK